MNDTNSDWIRVLAVGDVVGRPGRRILKRALPLLKARYNYHFLVVNVENAAGGFGITPEVYAELETTGVECMTSGNHIFDKKGYETWFPTASRLLRPHNFPPGVPGKGYEVFQLSNGIRLAVVNLIGRVFMKTYDCPFRAADEVLLELREMTPLILVDFHGEATSEKMAMGWFLSKRVSAVWGTHTHAPTADARILDGFTGFQTDLGMTGPYDSVIGMEKSAVLKGFLTLEKNRFQVAKGDVRLAGAVLDLDKVTGRCLSIQGIFLSEEDLIGVELTETAGKLKN